MSSFELKLFTTLLDDRGMKNNKIGDRLRRARESRQMSQTRLGETVKMKASRLSQLERGQRFPSYDEWTRLSPHLKLGHYPGQRRLTSPQNIWYATAPKLTKGERPFGVRLSAARNAFENLCESTLTTVRARPDVKACFEYLERAALESGDEALFHLRLLAEGATPCLFSPLRAGYRAYPVVDPANRVVIGDIRRPCLEFVDDEREYLVFPQTSILTAFGLYRLDSLVCLRYERRVWINLEIDGPAHRSNLDLRREQNLKLATLRLSRDDIVSPELMSNLHRALAELYQARRAKVA